MCDGDVSNLQGIKPLDRMMINRVDNPPGSKSSFTVWGTNHNYYNTEWQTSDSGGCTGHTPIFTPGATVGSTMQQQVGRAAVMGFFRGNVPLFPGDPNFTQEFNPQYGLPPVISGVTRVDRSYTDTPNPNYTATIDNFNMATGTSSYGVPNTSNGLSQYTHGTVPNHDAVQRAALVSWTTGGPTVWLQTNWTLDTESGVDISTAKTLDIRVSRQGSNLNPVGPTDFSIALAHDNGTRSGSVQLSTYTTLSGPVGGFGGNLHPILQTARIKLSDFPGADLAHVQGVRFTFNGTASGAIYLANVWVSDLSGSPATGAADAGVFQPSNDSADGTVVYDASNSINTMEIRLVNDSAALNHSAGVEIEVSSNRSFEVANELAVLRVGSREFDLSRYAGGDTNTLIFTLTAAEYRRLQSGADVAVQYGRGDHPNKQWIVGTL